jgi:hypothetical protein
MSSNSNRFVITTTLEGYTNALKPRGRYNNCTICFKIPRENLSTFNEYYEKGLAWGEAKFEGKRHEKALPKWEENGFVKYGYAGPNNPPMFPWVDTEGNPIDIHTGIWAGTEVKLIIDLKPYIYGNKVGCSMKVMGAQILKLVSGPQKEAEEITSRTVASIFNGTEEGNQEPVQAKPAAVAASEPSGESPATAGMEEDLSVASPDSRYRSKLEERVAKWLDLNDHSFEYESLKLPYTIQSEYIPDFVLPNGVILETKGWFKPEDRRKMLAVKEAHPELDIRLVFQNPRNLLSKDSETTYAEWAEAHGFEWAHYNFVPNEWFQ